LEKYNETQLDALKEFINIGTGQAALAMSKLIDKKVEVNVLGIKLEPLVKVPDILGGPENEIIGLYFKIQGGLTGSILLFFDKKVAEVLYANILEGVNLEDVPEDEEVKKSALKEIGNTLANSYINSLAEMLDERIYISVPYYSNDRLGAVVDFILIEIAEVADYALLMETVLESKDDKINGNFIIFPNSESLKKILRKMGF
jgi:chemotaxis protein CheC